MLRREHNKLPVENLGLVLPARSPHVEYKAVKIPIGELLLAHTWSHWWPGTTAPPR